MSLRTPFFKCVGLAFLILLVAGSVWPASLEEEGPPGEAAPRKAADPELLWRTRRACGVNCLYVLLRTYRIETDYEQLMHDLYAAAPEGESSLADLQAAAAARGLPLAAGKTSLESLRALEKPVIAHIEGAVGRTGGHFVLVLETNENAVKVMDGTSAAIVTKTWREFAQSWSGYLLLVKPPLSPAQEWVLWAVCLALGGGLGLGVDRLLHRRPVARSLVGSSSQSGSGETAALVGPQSAAS